MIVDTIKALLDIGVRIDYEWATSITDDEAVLQLFHADV